MYHICLPQCQIQLTGREEIDARRPSAARRRAGSAAPALAWPRRPPPRRDAWIRAATPPSAIAESTLNAPATTSPALLAIDRDCSASRSRARPPRRRGRRGASALARKRARTRPSPRRGAPPRRSGSSRRRGPAACGGCPGRPRRPARAQSAASPPADPSPPSRCRSARTRRHRRARCVRNPSFPASVRPPRPLRGSASPSGAGVGASIQPARTRASRIMASACARVTSKPLEKARLRLRRPRSSRRGRRWRSRRDPRAS